MTPDGRYLVVRGRLWRAANPALSEDERAELTRALMRARREVGLAMRSGDEAGERAARKLVHRAKIGLGERGPVWWSDGPDLNRRLIRNTPYREWFETASRIETTILAMLDQRDPSSSICPSEVARALAPEGWRALMEDVRDAARRLASRGEVVITQRGKALGPDQPFGGPVRIARPQAVSVPEKHLRSKVT